ncbi:MAG: hypothetical protein HYU54_05565 [Actinobacteria bacterium]|nr:hypothetical protein [Actinomycetota bacterium]
MKRKILGLIAATGLLVAVAPAAANASHLPRPYQIRLSVANLSPLTGAFYEVWAVYGSRKISAGGFNVDADGNLVDGFGHAARFFSPRDPASADAIVVTIEPHPDPDPAPSGIAVLAGAPGTDRASLRFPVRLGRAAGSFILATPTDAVSTDETAGIWFLDPDAGPGPSLDLPALPAGWVWEGWGVTQGTPLSTGRFTSASGADGSSAFSGPNPGPPFPGEDFLQSLPAGVSTPVDLADGSSLAVITIEPDLEGVDPTGAGPFSVKPLIAMIEAGAADHESIELERDLSTVPRGSATF